jgi:LacI family transcriptional regulator
VEEAIATLGYVPSLAARQMAGRRSYMLLALLEQADLREAAARLPLDAMLIAGIEACSAQGYRVVFEQLPASSRSNPALIESHLRAALGALQPDGVILLPPLDARTDLIAMLAARGIRSAALCPRAAHARPVPGSGDIELGDAAAHHLLALGHSQIAFMAGPGDAERSQRRLAGYRRALASRGSRAHRHFVCETPLDYGAAFDIARSWLVPTIRPTAIIAESAEAARAVVQAARSLKRSVPRELSVLSLEECPGLARSEPAISALHQPFAQMFAAACQRLIEASATRAGDEGDAGDKAARARAQPPPNFLLIERASLGLAPRAVPQGLAVRG